MLNLHEKKPVGGSHFHMNGFAQRLVLIQRQKATQKWSIRDVERHPVYILDK